MGSRCSIFIFGLLARPERADASRHLSRQPHPDDSQNHNLTPRDGRDETEQPERGQLN